MLHYIFNYSNPTLYLLIHVMVNQVNSCVSMLTMHAKLFHLIVKRIQFSQCAAVLMMYETNHSIQSTH